MRTIDFRGARLRVDDDGFVLVSDLFAVDSRGSSLCQQIYNYSGEHPDRLRVRRVLARGKYGLVYVSLSDFILWSDGFYDKETKIAREFENSVTDIPSLAVSDADSPFFIAYRSVLFDRLMDGVYSLRHSRGNNERNLLVFLVYSGLGGFGGFTLEDTARLFGLTRERVRQIFCKMLRLLKEKIKYDRFFDGLEDGCLFADAAEF